MHMRIRSALLLVVLVASSAAGTTYSRKATLADLATGWLGGPPRGIVEYVRLDLAADGTGVLVVQYLPQNDPVAYEVAGTRLKDGRVEFVVGPADRNAEGIYLRGRATPGHLDLEIGGLDLKWKREIFLEKEERVRGRIEAVSARAKAFRDARRAG